MIFKTGNPVIKHFEFSKIFGTVYNLLIDLLNEEISTFNSTKEQKEMIEKIDDLKGYWRKKVLEKQRQRLRHMEKKLF